MQRLWLVFAQAVTIALGILFVVSTLKPDWFSPATIHLTPEIPAAQSALSIEPATQPEQSPASPGSYRNAAQRALPSVVHVFTSQEVAQPRNPLLNDPFFRHFFGDQSQQPVQKRSGLGSGVIVSSEGYILTNNHVIEAADQIEVALNNGNKFAAHIVGKDPETDLAVLRINTKNKLPTMRFAQGKDLSVGDVVLAIGNPFGVGQTVTMGIVSATGRSQLGINTFEDFIQTDAAINPGNSGGALIDTEGNLVGINTAIYSRSGGSQGIGFAIPAASAREVMEQIIKTGGVVRGWIGIQVQEITPDLVASFDLPPQGILIAGLARNSPADKGGLLPGDVLVSIDGAAVNTPHGVLEGVAKLPPGRLVKLALVRRGKLLEATVQVARRPIPAASRE
ncbi:MAG: trypsin-like peptidase domain-containing protein [Uliginosibacterium sp.]|jgi:serine protease DegS/serine protease DegQ|nr:trypsin-like peptidase domain-containing protein [Uliginosibacterium sp.]MBK9614616.1 trypsin-like peptidase domain-containing protein [Uliginosibacterium sp.]